jgi:hypothetical protein
MRADTILGAVFPDYEQSAQTGKHRTLAELHASDPVSILPLRQELR